VLELQQTHCGLGEFTQGLLLKALSAGISQQGLFSTQKSKRPRVGKAFTGSINALEGTTFDDATKLNKLILPT